MGVLEADALPVAPGSDWFEAVWTRARAGGAGMIKGQAVPELLMLRCSSLSHHAVRAAARHAGLSLTVVFAENRREFLDELRRGSVDLIFTETAGLPDLDLHEIFERARSGHPPIPVVLAGGRLTENESVRLLREGAAEVLQSGEFDRLPSALARAIKVRQSAVLQDRVQIESERTALMLRDNQKLITVGRLAASIAHEVNNPLESVINLLYLLGEQPDLSQAARSYLDLAQHEVERVSQISRQTLNFSRETSGPVRVRIDNLLDEVLALYHRRILEKHLRVERQYHCPEDAIVFPGEIRQVLSNLVANAIEASSHNGRLHLRVRCTRNWSDPGVRGVRVSVGDNGIGIDPVVQRRLGEPFFTTKGQRGTGLGLWVTRSIVQRYGGEIHLRSSVSPARHGTVFSVFLPTNLRPQAVDIPQHPENNGGPDTVSFPERSTGNAGPAARDETRRRRANGC